MVFMVPQIKVHQVLASLKREKKDQNTERKRY